MKPLVQEGKSRPRLLGRRSVLVGLVGGIMAVGGGVFVLDKLLMSADTQGSRSSRVVAQASKTVPAQSRAGSSTRWTGPQRIAGQRSKITPALAVSSHGILRLVFVANDDNNHLFCLSSKEIGTRGQDICLAQMKGLTDDEIS